MPPVESQTVNTGGFEGPGSSVSQQTPSPASQTWGLMPVQFRLSLPLAYTLFNLFTCLWLVVSRCL